jgi:hypothetical protein
VLQYCPVALARPVDDRLFRFVDEVASMRVGLIVGYALLGLVDALVPAAIAATLLAGVGTGTLPTRWPVALVVGGAVLAVGFLAGAVSAARGGQSFPLTREALDLWRRYWWI